MNLACTHEHYNPSDAEFPLASAKLTAHSPNIFFALRSHIRQDKNPGVLANAVLAFSIFLYWTRLNGDLMEMLLSAGMSDLDQHTEGRCLQTLGGILYKQGRYEEAHLKLWGGTVHFSLALAIDSGLCSA